jgi:hypothetical protein
VLRQLHITLPGGIYITPVGISLERVIPGLAARRDRTRS